MKKPLAGLMSLCLTVLSGCSDDRPLPGPQVINLSCPKVTRCTLTESNPVSNGDLLVAKEQAEGDWAVCAAKVDMIVDCQEHHHE
ncbi:Rz1-like lysis system protein LysC [Leclercia adecarboxylata]|uniref:Rz1-like lysis system protein LysC n=1 Tax=Leclercia adecarboxylata TaxID=83655 RepID=UPI001C915BC0|nr:Rz1-like lysis system protein LysC [Leclercia adecarboxylata]MCE9980040.1 Rz1-like lysis system protein LysC [Leclercia adecarboxylata]